jgi:acyl carrier protein
MPNNAVPNAVLDKEDLRRTVADVLEREPEEITDHVLFVDELAVDSLVALEVLVVLERRYGVKIEEERLREITCLQRAYEVVAEKLESA